MKKYSECERNSVIKNDKQRPSKLLCRKAITTFFNFKK